MQHIAEKDWRAIFQYYEIRRETNGREIALPPKTNDALPVGVLRFSALLGVRTIGL
jgi:hypothetical protein